MTEDEKNTTTNDPENQNFLPIPAEGLTDRHGTHFPAEALRRNKRGDVIIKKSGIIIKSIGRTVPVTKEEIRNRNIGKVVRAGVRREVEDLIAEKTKDGELLINKLAELVKEKAKMKSKDYRSKKSSIYDVEFLDRQIRAAELLLAYMYGKPVERKLVKGQIDVFTWADALNNAVPIKNDSDIIDIETSEE